MGKVGTRVLLSLLIIGSLGIGYSLWPQPVHQAAHQAVAHTLTHLPDYVQQGDAAVQAAYQFAGDQPDLLHAIPCYCGCEKSLGHRDNLACYIATFKPDSRVATYTDHAAYCRVCLDITLAVKKMADEGQPVQAMHNAIDAQYGYTSPHTHPAEMVQ